MPGGPCAVNGDTRGCHIHRGTPPVGEGSQVVSLIGGGNGDDVGEVVAGGVEGALIGVAGVVSRGGHHEHSLPLTELDGLSEEFGEIGRPPTGIDDSGTLLDGMFDGEDGVADRPHAMGVQNTQGHNPRLPHHPRNSLPVVSHGGNGSRNMGTMAMIIHGVVISVDEVPSPPVIVFAIPIIIDAISRGWVVGV